MEEEEPDKVRQISLDEAKNIDTNQVAYFTLTDGTVVVVKPETEENKENTEEQKEVIESTEVQQNQNDAEEQQNEEEQQDNLQSKNENEQNNVEDINTDSQQIKTDIKNENQENVENVENQENQENIENPEQYENENQEYIVQNDNGVIEENYDNYVNNYGQPEQVEYIESNVNGGKMMSYGGIIEERNNYRFYASGIGYIEPEINEQQLIETEQNLIENQENEELLRQQQEEENYVDEQEQQICCYCGRPCDAEYCEHCQNSNEDNYYSNYQYNNVRNVQNQNYYPNVATRVGNVQGVVRQDGQLFKVIEAIPVKLNEYEDLEYVDNNYKNYRNVNKVDYVDERYIPDGYVIEEVDNNYYEDDKDNCCTCGDNQFEGGEYYICEEGPRCNCPIGYEDGEEVRVVRNVRRIPVYKDNYNYYESYGYSNNARVRAERAGRK